jgi:[amino group carrier protein]-lysine/ornithine hydrolase
VSVSADSPLPLLESMLACSSTSGQEGPLAALMQERMSKMGFDATIDQCGNILGEVGDPEGPRIMLIGHLDTVPGDVPLRRDGDLLFGRGAVDAKGPLATMVLAAAAAAEDGVPARFVVAGAVEEEVASSRGAHHLVATQPRPDALIVGEPNGWDGAGIAYKGRTGVTLDVRRPPAHTSAPAERAIEAAVGVWQAVREYLDGFPVQGEGDFDRPIAALTRIEGDIVRAKAEIVCRVPPGFDFEDFERHLDQITAGEPTRLDERTAAVEQDRRDPVVRALCASIRGAGARPRLKRKCGTCDMNIFVPAWNVPAAAYGPGDSALDHTDHEHVSITELDRAAGVLAEALASLPAVLAEAPAVPADPVAR